jgi:hypothetical protein
MLKREGEGETSARSSSEPSFGFSRDVCRMIVEDQLDSGVGRISGVEKLEEFDELAAAVAVADECMDLAIEQVDPSQQSDASIRSRNWAQPSAPGYWSFRIVPGAWRCGSHRCHFEPAASPSTGAAASIKRNRPPCPATYLSKAASGRVWTVLPDLTERRTRIDALRKPSRSCSRSLPRCSFLCSK